VRRSLGAAIAAAALAFALFAAAGLRAGWRVEGADLWRWTGLGLALAVWAWVLIPWWRGHVEWSAADHQRGMYRALGAWAVTDAVVVLAWAT